MIGAFQSFCLIFTGYVLIFSGIAFSNKLFFPSVFDSIYQMLGFGLRTVVFTIIFALPANYLIAKSFGLTSASIAGPMLIAVVVLLSVGNAMILDKVQFTLPITGALAGALFFSCLTAWLLEGQRVAG